jgi:hypothetical protein
MGGSNTASQLPIYGTIGIPAAGNTPGARFGTTSWRDGSGNFWIYGGTGAYNASTYGFFADLWKLDHATLEWAWMGGSSTLNLSGSVYGQPGVYGTLGTPAAGNTPGSRTSAASWTDASGNLWLFGGTSEQADYNDLWELNLSTLQWTWMGGSIAASQSGSYGMLGIPAAGNNPGSRDSATTWTDSNGNFWLFGGTGLDSAGGNGPLNDLWEFNNSSHQWTWISGSSTISCVMSTIECGSQPGIYGTLGVPAAGNAPGGRLAASGWTDNYGNLWLFGGAQLNVGAGSSYTYLNDLWEFNPSTLKWVWMGGGDTAGQSGVYGTPGVPAAGNVPGSRSSALTWTDRNGKLWLLGGESTPPSFTSQHTSFNDLWELDLATLQWAWMGGNLPPDCSNQQFGCGQPASYGTLGFPGAGNDPGGREMVAAWLDASDNLWLYGGLDHSTTQYTPYGLNDLWELGAVAPPPAPTFSLAAGTYTPPQTLTITDSSSTAVVYYTTDGSTPSTSSNINSSPITLNHTTTVTAFAAVTGLMNSPLTTATYTLQATPAVTVTPSATTITTAQALSVAVSISGGNGTATGSVTLSSGSYTSTAATLSGGGTTINIPANSLSAGTATLNVTYTPDTASAPIYTTASGTVSVVVTVPIPVTFVLSNSGNISINRGATTGNTGTSTILATPSGGLTGSVNLSCAISSAPANVVDAPTCSLSPAAVTIAGTTAVTSTLTIATTASASTLNHPFQNPFQRILAPASGIAFACICFLGFPGRRTRRGWLIVLLFVAASVVMSGCSSSPGSSGGSGGTTVGNYTVTITGVSGSIIQTTSVSLTVGN